MRIADLVGFVAGAPPDFHAPDAVVSPGERFGRYDARGGWSYVEVTGLNDGRLPAGCVYARAFSRAHPAGRAGYWHPSQLALRIDDGTWGALRASGWPRLGVVLGIGVDDQPAPRPFDG